MKRCNCSDWDDESPCKVHIVKLRKPDFVEHHVIVIKIYRKSENKKYYGTVVKDATSCLVTDDFNIKAEVLNEIGKKLQNIKI